MEPFRYHVYLCDQTKADGVHCCRANGAAKLLEALRRELASQGLDSDVQVTTCGSLGLCESGPNMVVYPDGVWYSHVGAGDAAEIVREHLGAGRIVERLVRNDSAQVRAEIEQNRARMIAATRLAEKSGLMPDDLRNMFRAFQDSRVLLTAIELDMFTVVGTGTTSGDVARRCATDERATEMLLNCLVSFGLLAKTSTVFSNTPQSSRFLRAGGEHDSRLAMMHTANLWKRWSTLTEAVRTGTAEKNDEIIVCGADWTRSFIAAMHNNAAARAPMVAKAAGLRGVKKFIDIGGGSGAYSIAFARETPDLCAVVFDLKTVLPLAEQYVRDAGLSDRISTVGGDMRVDELGTGYDMALLSAICHMFAPDGNRQLFARVYRALKPGGRLIIQDFVLDSDKTAPRNGVVFALNMLVGTEAGSSYSFDEYQQWLHEAGFSIVRKLPLAGPTGLIEATI